MFCLPNFNHFISLSVKKLFGCSSLFSCLSWRSFNYFLLFLRRKFLFWSSLWLTASPSPLSSSPSSPNSPLYLPLIPLTQDMMITIIAKIEQEPELCHVTLSLCWTDSKGRIPWANCLLWFDDDEEETETRTHTSKPWNSQIHIYKWMLTISLRLVTFLNQGLK